MYVQGLTFNGARITAPSSSSHLSSSFSSSFFFFLLLSEFQKTYLQGKNRDADKEKGLVDTVGEGEDGIN